MTRAHAPASAIAIITFLLLSRLSSGEERRARPALPGIGLTDRRVVVDPQSPPWNAVAKIQTNTATRCSGTLVAPSSVLTAAHCLYNPRTRVFLQPQSLHVLFGYRRGSYRWHGRVARYVIGEGFDGGAPGRHPGSDWARLELAEAVPSDDRAADGGRQTFPCLELWSRCPATAAIAPS